MGRSKCEKRLNVFELRLSQPSIRQSPPGSTLLSNSTQLSVCPRSYDLQFTALAQAAYVHLPTSQLLLFRLVQYAAPRERGIGLHTDPHSLLVLVHRHPCCGMCLVYDLLSLG